METGAAFRKEVTRMTTEERREAIKDYKSRRGCHVCGRRPDPRWLGCAAPRGFARGGGFAVRCSSAHPLEEE